MVAPADQPNGVHVGLTNGNTFYIPAGETPTLVPEEFQAAALAAGAIPAEGPVAAERARTPEEQQVIDDEAEAEARAKARNA